MHCTKNILNSHLNKNLIRIKKNLIIFANSCLIKTMNSDEDIEIVCHQNNDTSAEILSSDDEVETSHDNEKSAVTISDSDSDTDENLPSGPECLRRCKDFATITETDQALAMFFLQQNKWDLDVSTASIF